MPRGGRQRGCETLRDAVGTLAWTEEEAILDYRHRFAGPFAPIGVSQT